MFLDKDFMEETHLISQAWLKEAFSSAKDANLTSDEKAETIRKYLVSSARHQKEITFKTIF